MSEAAPDPRRMRRRRRWKRLGIGAGIALVFYVLFGFVGVPLLIQKVVVPRLNKRLNGTLTLEKARFNPFTLALRLEGGQVKDDAGRLAAGFDTFEGSFNAGATVFKAGWRFGEVVLTNPVANPEIGADGRLNLRTLVKFDPNAKPGEPLKKIPHLVAERVAIRSATVLFRDLSLPAPFETEWKDIDFTIEPVDTDPAHRNPHTLTAGSGAGAKAEWTGGVHVNPLTSDGTLRLSGIDIARFMPYVMRRTDARLVAGTATIDLAYDFAPVQKDKRAAVTVTSLGIADASIRLHDRPLVDAGLVEISGVKADAAAKSIGVERVRITRPTAHLRREASGAFEITTLLLAGGGAAPGPNPEPARPRVDPLQIQYPVDQLFEAIGQLLEDATGGWAVAAQTIEIEDGTATFSDAAARSPVEVPLAGVAIEAGPFGTEGRWRLPFKAAMRVGAGGNLTAEGTVAIIDRKPEGKVKGDSIALKAFAPYLPREMPRPLAPMDLEEATLGLEGHLAAELAADGPTLLYDGDLSLAEVRVLRAGSSEPTLTATAIRLHGKTDAAIGAGGLRSFKTDSEAQVDVLTVESPLAGPIAAGDGLSIDAKRATLDANGRLGASLEPDGSASVTWVGEARVSDVLAADAGAARPLVQLGSLTLKGDATVASPKGGSVILAWKGLSKVESLEGNTPGAEPNKVGAASAEADGELKVSVPSGGEAAATFQGRAAAAGLKSAGTSPEHSLDVATVTLTGIDFQNQSKTLAISEMVVAGSNVKVLAELLPPTSSAPAPSPSAGAPAAQPGPSELLSGRKRLIPYDVRVERLSLTGSAVELRDGATTPPATFVVDDVDVQMTHVNTGGGATEIKGSTRVQGSGRATVSGTVDAFAESPSADVVLDVASVGLKPYDAFAARFVGYLIDSGRMTLRMPLKVEGSRVIGSLDFAFDNLHLGQSTPSPDAPNVPIKMGLDLLRDPGDRIVGNVPFEGNMKDPGFKLSGLIWRAFFNFLLKAATAPFQVIGSLFGAAEGQDLSKVVFESGSAELNARALSNTDVIGRAMRERPSIKLTVIGRAGGDADVAALKPTLLREAILHRVQARDKRVQTLTADRYKSEMAGEYKDRLGEPVAPDAGGRSQRMTFEQMEAALIAQMEVPVDRLAALAKRRAEAVVAVLTKDHGVAAERVRIGEAAEEEKPVAEPIAEFRVE